MFSPQRTRRAQRKRKAKRDGNTEVTEMKNPREERFLTSRTPFGMTRFHERGTLPRSLHYAARRAKIRRGREVRAAPVGMTMQEKTNPRTQSGVTVPRRFQEKRNPRPTRRTGVWGTRRWSGRAHPFCKRRRKGGAPFEVQGKPSSSFDEWRNGGLKKARV